MAQGPIAAPDARKHTPATMVTGVMVGRITEQQGGHIILGDGTRLALAAGLSVEGFDSGELVTISYGRDRGGELVVESITRNASPRTYYVC
jgi:hypothetical protein